MTWRDQYQQGSYRGVPFLTESADGQFGRRNQVHEYPGRDVPYVEDLGKAAREFTIECLVLGANYMAARDQLIDAFEKPGPGTLVHPYRGTMQVSIKGKARIRESSRHGGSARITLSFVESGENLHPTQAADTQSVVNSRADAAIVAAASDFSATFSTSGQPEFVRAAAQSTATNSLDSLNSLVQKIPQATGQKTGFETAMATATETVGDLVQNPSDLATSMTGLIGQVLGVAGSAQAAVDNLVEMAGFGDDLAAVPTTTATRRLEGTNQQAITDLTRQSAAVEAVRASSQTTYASRTDAIAARDTLAELLDDLAMTALDDTFIALAALRAGMAQDLTTRGAGLPDVIDYTPAITLPALVIAHQVHGDATREGEIVTRNHISHPGFVNGGQALEVLTA